MPAIEKSVDQSRGITTYQAGGVVSARDIIASNTEFYENAPTALLLWDFTGADLSGLSSEDLQAIVAVSRRLAHLRPPGKTAIVAPSSLEFGVSRMYETFTKIWEHPVPHQVFKSRDEALEWLQTMPAQ